MAFNDIEAIRASISSPKYAYSRARSIGGAMVTWIYHSEAKSPTGVSLNCSGDSDLVDPIIRELRNNSPLSPTEGLNKSGVSAVS